MKFPLLQIPVPEIVPDSIPAPAQEMGALKNITLDELINRLVKDTVDFAIHLAIAIVVFYIGKFIISRIYNVTGSILAKREVERSLSTFILSLIRIVLYFILLVTVIGILGINTSSFIALFASAGVAIGMALSGTLQNFAGGVLILLLKPYKIGNYIEAQGFAGTVTEIQIFSTLISTPDNKSINIPNGALSTGSINNWSLRPYRRVQWDVGISYGDDFDTASAALMAILDSEPLIIRPGVEQIDKDAEEAHQKMEDDAAAQNPADAKKKGWFRRMLERQKEKIQERNERQAAAVQSLIKSPVKDPTVNISELADSSVNLVVRAWVRTDDYWTVYNRVIERIYKELPLSGVSFPFPQMDVHVVALPKGIGSTAPSA